MNSKRFLSSVASFPSNGEKELHEIRHKHLRCPVPFPHIKMFMGSMGSAGEGLFVKIADTSVVCTEDLVVLRVLNKKSSKQRGKKEKTGSFTTTSLITGSEGQEAWVSYCSPIQDAQSLSVWTKVAGLPTDSLLKITNGKSKFNFHGQSRSGARLSVKTLERSRKYLASTVIDFVVMRKGAVVSQSNRYLLQAVYNGKQVRFFYREL